MISISKFSPFGPKVNYKTWELPVFLITSISPYQLCNGCYRMSSYGCTSQMSAHIFEIHALVHAFFLSSCVNILFISKNLKYWNCRRVSLRVWPWLLIKNDERFCVQGLNLVKNLSIYRAISSQYASLWLYLVVLGRIYTRLYHEGGEQNFWFGFWYELMAAISWKLSGKSKFENSIGHLVRRNFQSKSLFSDNLFNWSF